MTWRRWRLLLAVLPALAGCSAKTPASLAALPAGANAVAMPLPSAPLATAPARPAQAASAGVIAAAPLPAAIHQEADGGKRRPHSFVPPAESTMPDGPFGEAVRRGREIFVHTAEQAGAYVGNGLACSNCHLDAGRLANAAPLWAAYGMYPQYRRKNHHVNSYGERLQGCFEYSMNGKAPPLDSPEIVALEAYSYWMATGAPVGVALAGAGYPPVPSPALPPSAARGRKIFEHDCALCHGADGQGQKAAGRYVFPPLWGPDSFNWGAGMHRVNTAAAFIQANMPLSRGGLLSDQEAWDVAFYMDGHERPQDPRYNGSVAATRKAWHDTPQSLYGTRVDGHLLGTGTPTQ